MIFIIQSLPKCNSRILNKQKQLWILSFNHCQTAIPKLQWLNDKIHNCFCLFNIHELHFGNDWMKKFIVMFFIQLWILSFKNTKWARVIYFSLVLREWEKKKHTNISHLSLQRSAQVGLSLTFIREVISSA